MLESSNFVYMLRTIKCNAVSKTKVVRIIFAFFFYFLPFSISLSNVMIMAVFVCLYAHISWNFFRRGSYIEKIIIFVIHKHDKEKGSSTILEFSRTVSDCLTGSVSGFLN